MSINYKSTPTYKRMLAKIQFLSDVGLDPEDYPMWNHKYLGLRPEKSENREFTLTFEEYINMALQVGMKSPNEIGPKADQFCMGRYGDAGGYTPGNCRFITNAQNIQEAKDNNVYFGKRNQLQARS
jgi:hypothetical protein